ncbi:class I SAM-dependent methyltransferase, partial [Aquabacterium sp.]|uniref:class I SAM-dependent methyltransferase n=1 Tax=Aquabacterium sp. TaxID=1872578 RepID=UPI002B6E68EA
MTLRTLPPPASPPPASTPCRLGAVSSTLFIPLAARAHGDALYPELAVNDAHAARLLQVLGVDVQPFLADRPTLYGILARTHILRDQAREFFAQHPGALGVSLGCGLAHYHQWLDNGRNRWIDADVPEVAALRETLLPAAGTRRRNASIDLTQPGWWQQLDLPGPRARTPVLLQCEGVLMYLTPAQVAAVLQEIGDNAPAGSVLLFDFVTSFAVGFAGEHPSVRYTGAEFRWGPRRMSDISAAHARLALRNTHPVMEA